MAEPRRHHYRFAHRELPSAVFHFGDRMVTAGRGFAARGRTTTGGRPGGGIPPVRRHEILLVSFPQPTSPGEAHFAVVFLSRAGAPARYFTVEYARSPMTDVQYTVLAEWTQDGNHLNYGPGPR